MRLFELTDTTIKPSSEEIFLHKELLKIYARDNSKNKDQALKEFKFIYAMCDYRSYPNKEGLSDKERLQYSLELSELGKSFDYNKDKDLIIAMQKYYDLNMTVVRETNIELLRAFRSAHNVVKLLREEIESMITKIKTNTNTEERNKAIRNLVTKQKELQEIANTIPKSMSELQLSMRQVKEEEDKTDGEQVRGGVAVGDSQNPETDIVPR